jgi:hypothetical protein
MMHSSDEDIELCSVDRFGSIEPNRTFSKKNTKIIKKFGYSSPWQNRISSIEFGSIRNSLLVRKFHCSLKRLNLVSK